MIRYRFIKVLMAPTKHNAGARSLRRKQTMDDRARASRGAGGIGPHSLLWNILMFFHHVGHSGAEFGYQSQSNDFT